MAKTGPGKYDAACVHAFVETRATAAVLLILGGEHGHGFSVNTSDPGLVKLLPALLREVADSIEEVS